MARSHGKILSSIWRDPSWLALTKDAKGLYVLLLTQPNLTLVGSLDLAVGRWSTYSPDDSREAMQAAVDELRAARFVVVDDTTDELLVRSFTAHDIDPNRVNVNLARGLWGSWGAIASPVLRSIAVHEMPDEVWEKLEPHAPADAVQTRRSPRLEPAERPPVGTGEGAPGRSSLPPPYLPPVTTHPPAAARPKPTLSTARTQPQGVIASEDGLFVPGSGWCPKVAS